MAVRWANFAQGRLTAAVAPADTVISYRQDPGTPPFPALAIGDEMYCVLYKENGSPDVPEVVRVTAAGGGSFTCVRGVGETSAGAYAADDYIENRVTAEVLDALRPINRPVLLSLEEYEALGTPTSETLYLIPEPDQ